MKRLIALVFVICGVAVLCTLGTWQVQRLQWKTAILDRLDAEYAKQVAEHSLTFKDLDSGGDQLFFARGIAEGRFLTEHAVRLGRKPKKGVMGQHVIVPLALEDGGIVFVNTGWLPIEAVLPDLPSEAVRVEGLARLPTWTSFTPENSAEHDIWMRPDPADLARIKGLDTVSDVMIYAERVTPDITGLDVGLERWQPRNNHLQYAIFWFVMAGALIGVAGFVCYGSRQRAQ